MIPLRLSSEVKRPSRRSLLMVAIDLASWFSSHPRVPKKYVPLRYEPDLRDAVTGVIRAAPEKHSCTAPIPCFAKVRVKNARNYVCN